MVSELSIIIPTLNEENYLPHLLESISHQHFEGKIEVIVVDGGSKDQTVKRAQSFKDSIPNLTIIQTGKGVGFQRNRGAEKAQHKYLLFIDADTYLPKGFLKKLMTKLNPSEQFIIFGMVLPRKFNVLDYSVLFFGYFLIYIANYFRPILGGPYMVTTKENHERIGGFDEKAVVGEDIEYGFRSVKYGARYRMFLRPYIRASTRRVRHVGRWKLFWMWIQWYLYIHKNGAIYDKNLFHYPFGHYKGEE